MPMVQSVQSERFAPPFGVFVHESARAFAPKSTRPFTDVWWKWFQGSHKDLSKNLRQAFVKYAEWCKKRARAIEYDEDRIETHEKLIGQYIAEP
jgi:hypothetical protein